MTAEPVNIFFYGLFMDMGLLQQRGLAPRNPQSHVSTAMTSTSASVQR